MRRQFLAKNYRFQPHANKFDAQQPAAGDANTGPTDTYPNSHADTNSASSARANTASTGTGARANHTHANSDTWPSASAASTAHQFRW